MPFLCLETIRKLTQTYRIFFYNFIYISKHLYDLKVKFVFCKVESFICMEGSLFGQYLAVLAFNKY